MTNPADDLRYNEIRQKSVHNCFQRDESIADQFLYWRVRSMEVDVHHEDPLKNLMRDGDWSVHHDWYDPISAVSRLSQFLKMMRGLNRLNPHHEVCTLFIDIKDAFPENPRARHGADAFDKMLARHLGASLYRPRRMITRARGATSLRDAIARRGWPTLKELRGKFLVVLTGGPTELEHYASSAGALLDRAAFLSVPVNTRADIIGPGDEIFFNVSCEKHPHLVKHVHAAGYVSRAFYVDDVDRWNAAAAAMCHHPATDMVSERMDPWSSTTNPSGFPFDHIDGSSIAGCVEAGPATGIWARSNDMWGKHDSLVFHHRQVTAKTADNTLDYAISGANSHTDDWVKGALMARADLDPDGAYFAVVRNGERHGLRIQYRRKKGAPTTVMTTEIGPGGIFGRDIDQDTIVHVRLGISANGRTATGWGSYERSRWVKLGSVTFDGESGDKPLRFQGLAVSSHGQRRGAKFLFVPSRSSQAMNFTRTVLIGADDDHAGWVDESGDGRWLTTGFSSWRQGLSAAH